MNNCPVCKKNFEQKGRKDRPTTYCSVQCSNTAMSHRRWKNHEHKHTLCKQCNGLFLSYNSKKIFCSSGCKAQYKNEHKIQCVCYECNINFTSYRNSKFCSYKCRIKNQRGINAIGYKNGQTFSKQSGEIMVLIKSKNLYTREKYIARKRVVVQKIIGRTLHKSEIVIHLNGNKLDDKPENLYICDLSTAKSIINGFTHIKESNIYNYK